MPHMKYIATALIIAATLALAAPALAQDQNLVAPAPPTIAVVQIGTVNGLTFAKIRDDGMRGHNVYCIAVGARVGNATVTKISDSTVEMSDGRVYQSVPSATKM